jgi:PKD repeat protein
MKNNIYTTSACFLIALGLFAQPLPELMYYTFDNGSKVINQVASPVGDNPLDISGSQLSVGGSGLAGTALQGTGAPSTNHKIATNWQTEFTGSFTIGFWTSNIAVSNQASYLFGDSTANELRCFTGGIAGNGNWMLRASFPIGFNFSIVAIGGASQLATFTHFVFDASTNLLLAYVNGVQVDSDTITGTPNFVGQNFSLGGFINYPGLSGNLDEFRVYNRALSPTEILNSYQNSLFNCPTPQVNVQITNCTDANITWAGAVDFTQATLELGPVGFQIGTGVITTTTSQNVILPTFDHSAVYDVFLRENCAAGLGPIIGFQIFTDSLPEAIFSERFIEVSQIGATFEFDASASVRASRYEWFYDDGGSDTGQLVQHTFLRNTIFVVALVVHNDCGSDTMRKAIDVRGISASTEQPLQVKIFPNPFDDFLQISGIQPHTHDAVVSIFGNDGRLVMRQGALSDGIRLDLRNLPAGVFFIELRTEEAVRRQKIVKQHYK